ncbi:receptor-like serine/threonine-protein kinase At1g78530 [Physcomitrium patens]|uniref:Protein kinase domain-containing protein n=1 Tax=Physcomitrium patens TaxID=3218 RepID=A0A2K1IC85_PHYPA|nr:receptor-like serine/threonine-protein kinase At1g78530 [Physcomitrium patens]PNR26898.1 hypothetical protein PHYPA_030379 [Physcomitrium patens]|eukprot:XP_024366699.1 receptor-like serine/threonine-protein kinase At1g78530 [Physcomitrella patens]
MRKCFRLCHYLASAWMGRHSWWVLLLCIVWTLLEGRFISALNDEGHALLEFSSRLNDTGGNLVGWNSSHSTPCGWSGVGCSEDLHVVSVNLSGKQLEGNLTLDATRLVQLQLLNLSSNVFRGAIPSLLGNAANLSILDVSNNVLRGYLPKELDSLWALSFLNVSNNELEGTLPQGGVLASFGSSSYWGNELLCGNPTGRTCGNFRYLLEKTDASAETPANQLSVGAIVAICLSAFLVSKITLFSIWYCRRRKKRECEVKLSGGRMVMFPLTGQAVTPLSKAVLRKTQKLRPQDIIGSGGYGTVYKIVLDDLSAFAVKKMTKCGTDRDLGFERELQTLADVKHRNLVTLRGYYATPEINFLIYDLMPNGNLETILHDYANHNREPIDWELRLRIALGVARGLSYLHYDCIPHIIHRDIKCSNILLDDDMEAHVADFGLAKFINTHETHVTTMAAGTLGYLPPEYLETGKITEKGDVYSFGIVLLELLTGKRPKDDDFRDHDFNIVDWANALRAEGRPEDIFDENILGAVLDEDLLTTLNIALQCTNEMPKTRPNMHHIVKMLQRLQGEDDYSFCSSRNLSHKISLDSQFSLSSSNTASSDSPRAFYSCDVV